MISTNSTMLREKEERAVIRVVRERNKWLIINLLTLLIILIEQKTLFIFYILALPRAFLTIYSTTVTVTSTFCGLSVLGHLVFICRSLAHLIVRRCGSDSRNGRANASAYSVGLTDLSSRSFLGPTVFSSSMMTSFMKSSPSYSRMCNYEASGPRQSTICGIRSSVSETHRMTASQQSLWTSHLSSCFSVEESSIHCLTQSGEQPASVSLLSVALSPIVGPPLYADSIFPRSLENAMQPGYMNILPTNLSPMWNAFQTPSLQYQTSSSPSSSPRHGSSSDHLGSRSSVLVTPSFLDEKHLSSGTIFGDSRHTPLGGSDQLSERSSTEYWNSHGVTESRVEQYVIDLRKWLHGTIFRRLVDEITTINRHLSETSGNDALIGSVTLTTLQELCSTKYQYLPSLPVVLSFLEFMKDHGYLVNRLKELARGCCLEEFRWDSGSRSLSWPWKEHLPNDSLILLHMFATYMDLRMPPHPKCPAGRVFTHLCIVRHPDKPDMHSRHNTQLYQLSVQPPHFKLILDGKMYSIPSGPKNLFHAILMCFHHSFTVDGKFRSVSLGPSGLNVAWMFSK